MRCKAVLALFGVAISTFSVLAQDVKLDETAVQARLAKQASLFRRYGTRRRADDLKPNARGVVDMSPTVVINYIPRSEPFSPRDELNERAKLSEAIVQGTAERRYSVLTPTHSFIYSDWVVKVSSVFKGTSLVPVKVGDEITVFRPGGEVLLNGLPVVARDMTFPDFAVGKEYVLYLGAHADSSSFEAFDGGSFDVSGAHPVPLIDPRNTVSVLPKFCAAISTADFIGEVQRSANQ